MLNGFSLSSLMKSAPANCLLQRIFLSSGLHGQTAAGCLYPILSGSRSNIISGRSKKSPSSKFRNSNLLLSSHQLFCSDEFWFLSAHNSYPTDIGLRPLHLMLFLHYQVSLGASSPASPALCQVRSPFSSISSHLLTFHDDIHFNNQYFWYLLCQGQELKSNFASLLR
jgi:hypothetical protein